MSGNIERLVGSVVAIPCTDVDSGLCVTSGSRYISPSENILNSSQTQNVIVDSEILPPVSGQRNSILGTDHALIQGSGNPYLTNESNGAENPISVNSITELSTTHNLDNEVLDNVHIVSNSARNISAETLSARQQFEESHPAATNDFINPEIAGDQAKDINGLALEGETRTSDISGISSGKKDNSEDDDRLCVYLSPLTRIGNNRQTRILMASRIKRWKSFGTCPSHIKDKQELALAGFYFEGYGDCTRCFYCGGGLRNWEQEDDVWVEHAKWFPKCGYVIEQMGNEFIQAVLELKVINEKISLDDVKKKIADNRIAQSILTKCKMCHTRKVEVTFYGCGHLACYYCAHIDKSRPCHVCGRDIKGRLQTKI